MEDGSMKIGEKPMPHRILIVDDEETALKRMKSLMENRGYETHTATRGKQALDLLKVLSFDLVLTDLILDSVDGLAILSYRKISRYGSCHYYRVCFCRFSYPGHKKGCFPLPAKTDSS
jgi:PleD family two-component response regulator